MRKVNLEAAQAAATKGLEGVEHDEALDAFDRELDLDVADWKSNPDTVLKTVDNMLSEFGLEVVMYEQESDSYLFKIVKLEEDSD